MANSILKSGKFWIGVAISAVFLYVAFRGIDFRALGKTLVSVNIGYVLIGVALYYFNLAVRAIRWQYIYRHVKRASFWSIFGATVIGYFANNVLPMRLGEVARAVYIGEKEGTDKSASLGTIAVERIFDGLMALVVLGVTFVVFPFPQEIIGEWKIYFQRAGEAFAGVSFVGLIVMIVMTRRREWTLKILDKVLAFLPEKPRKTVGKLAYSFIGGLNILKSPLEVAALTLLSVAVWVTNMLPLYFAGLAFRVPGLRFGIADQLLLITSGSAAAAIPAAPGFVGTFHYATKMAIEMIMQVKFIAGGINATGVAESAFGEWGLSFAVLSHALYIVTTTVTGAIWLAASGVSFSRLRGDVETVKHEKTKL